MTSIFGERIAKAVCISGIHSFLIGKPILMKGMDEVVFTTGQALGFYGSWSLFALSHHFVVWLAAEKVRKCSSPFTDYAILGDDVVIAVVAIEYRQLLQRLGVSISVPKSIISRNGTLEFAKKFWSLE